MELASAVVALSRDNAERVSETSVFSFSLSIPLAGGEVFPVRGSQLTELNANGCERVAPGGGSHRRKDERFKFPGNLEL